MGTKKKKLIDTSKRNGIKNNAEKNMELNAKYQSIISMNTMGEIFAGRSRRMEPTIFHTVFTVRNKYK